MKINLSAFNSLIFDFGGVILDINPERTWNAFGKFAPKERIQQVINSGLLETFETGKITAAELRGLINQKLDETIDDATFDRAWNAMLIDYKPKRIERIQWLKKKHRLFLLSNTNQIHYAFFSKKLEQEYGVSFSDLFHHTYLSHEMGLIKPDAEIFRQVLIEQQLDPEKTLFIEDTRENADAAAALGIETLVIPRNGNFYEYFL
ncbi:MAG: HAD-IA family hydrolase [Salinivirgaceae bacterium]